MTAQLSNSDVEYCVDGDGNWKALPADTATESINSGQTLSFRANLLRSGQIGTYTITKSCNLLGNCTSLIYGDNAADNTSLEGYELCFGALFAYNTTIKSVSSTFLPSTTLARNCYLYMFLQCSNLKTPPKLPAMILADACYAYMFNGCTSMTSLPALKAETLSANCYQYMFADCTSLAQFQWSHTLPATIMAQNCYYGMFQGCTSLSASPSVIVKQTAKQCCTYMFKNCSNLIWIGTEGVQLLADTLSEDCYNEMFNGCTKLNSIKMLATDISATDCLKNWVQGVSSGGTFVKHTNMTSLPTGDSGIPSGWTVENATE